MNPATATFGSLAQGKAFLSSDSVLCQKIQTVTVGSPSYNAIILATGAVRAFVDSDVVTPVLGTVNL